MSENFNKSIRKFYSAKYPSDEAGRLWLRWGVTFGDLAYDLASERDNFDFYDEYMPCGGDSLVRERIFRELARMLDIDYSSVFDAWLYHDDISKKQALRDAIVECSVENRWAKYWEAK